jgi:hypothetical protein
MWFAVTLAICPLRTFEAFYQHEVSVVGLPALSAVSPQSALLENGLWVALGEAPNERLDALWAGNFFAGKSAGRRGINEVARLAAQTSLSGPHTHLRQTVIAVWLSRYVTEGELKRHLAEASSFGRGARGGAPRRCRISE